MAIIGPVGTSSSSPLPVDLSSILSSASLNKIVGVLFTFQVHFLSSKLGITLMLFDIYPKLAWTGWKWQTWKLQHQAWNLESGTTIQQDTPLGTSPDIQDTSLDTPPLDTSPLDTSPDTDSTFFRIRLLTKFTLQVLNQNWRRAARSVGASNDANQYIIYHSVHIRSARRLSRNRHV